MTENKFFESQKKIIPESDGSENEEGMPDSERNEKI